jgi:hypothetical protein
MVSSSNTRVLAKRSVGQRLGPKLIVRTNGLRRRFSSRLVAIGYYSIGSNPSRTQRVFYLTLFNLFLRCVELGRLSDAFLRTFCLLDTQDEFED